MSLLLDLSVCSLETLQHVLKMTTIFLDTSCCRQTAAAAADTSCCGRHKLLPAESAAAGFLKPFNNPPKSSRRRNFIVWNMFVLTLKPSPYKNYTLKLPKLKNNFSVLILCKRRCTWGHYLKLTDSKYML